MADNERIVEKAYRILTGESSGKREWSKIAFWTKSSQVDHNGKKLSDVLPGIQGIANDLTANSPNMLATAAMVQAARGETDSQKILQWYIDRGILPKPPATEDLEKIPGTLEECTWDQIYMMASTGTFREMGFNVGNTKTIKINGLPIVMEVASINTDTVDNHNGRISISNVSSGAIDANRLYYPRGTIDFISKDVLPNATMFYSGNANMIGGFPNSAINSYINSASIYEGMADDLKKNIFPKLHLYSTNISNNAPTNMAEAETRLWLPSMFELTGVNTYCSEENSSNNIRYAAYSDNNTSRIKRLHSNQGVVAWWTCSRHTWWSDDGWGTRSGVRYITSDGRISEANAHASLYFPICFRIGKPY